MGVGEPDSETRRDCRGKPVRVVVLGGGIAGWMTAAGIAKLLPRTAEVQLVESEDIGIVGVGEATLPHIRGFVEKLGIDEAAFMKATHATYKLGIDPRFRTHRRKLHPPVRILRGRTERSWLPPLLAGAPRPAWPMAISLAVAAALANKSGPRRRMTACRRATAMPTSSMRHCSDRSCAISGDRSASGVTRPGRLGERVAASGDIAALTLEDGRRIEGTFSSTAPASVPSCWDRNWGRTGRTGRTGCPISRGGDAGTHQTQDIRPYTTATAMPAGWRWQIPCSTAGNGYVFSSAHISRTRRAKPFAMPQRASRWPPRILRLPRSQVAVEPQRHRRRPGKWFLEPLESTSIYLAQMAITYLIELFPEDGRIDPRDRDEFNRLVDMEYDRVRDVILHYHATSRDDPEFWNHVRTMTVPDSLKEDGIVAQGGPDREIFRRSVLRCQLDRGLCRAGLLLKHDARPALGDPQQLARAAGRLCEAVRHECPACLITARIFGRKQPAWLRP